MAIATPPPTADIAKVRALTGLGTLEVTDDELTVLLEVHDGAVKYAAASALETVAGQLATITASSDEISVDGSKRAGVLMALAARLRAEADADAEDAGFTFDVVPAFRSRAELTHGTSWC